MEALGRAVTVLLGVGCLVLLLFFCKTAAVHRQKSETICSISEAYVQRLQTNRHYSETEWRAFANLLQLMGEYRAELTVYERRRYEGESGRIYLYTEWKQTEAEKEFTEGSYVRLVIKEENRGKLAELLYGADCVCLAGGRMR